MSWDRRRWRGGGNRQEGNERRESRPPGTGFSPLAQRHNIDAFELFCAYHLGITEEGGYRFQNIHQVAKRFGANAGIIKQVLADLSMDSDTIVHSSFDMASAQVDIMLAPEGVSRAEIAKRLFEEFKSAPRRNRDWKKELEQDARDNERIFGRR
jgi:hypothetical protein